MIQLVGDEDAVTTPLQEQDDPRIDIAVVERQLDGRAVRGLLVRDVGGVKAAIDGAGVGDPPIAIEQTPAVDGVERLQAAHVARVFGDERRVVEDAGGDELARQGVGIGGGDFDLVRGLTPYPLSQ